LIKITANEIGSNLSYIWSSNKYDRFAMMNNWIDLPLGEDRKKTMSTEGSDIRFANLRCLSDPKWRC
jgi:hypothetical protein